MQFFRVCYNPKEPSDVHQQLSLKEG